tara:strand:- start:412 stop:1272 length:861 start_codon:yes stop_codon:yes gene_type:complete
MEDGEYLKLALGFGIGIVVAILNSIAGGGSSISLPSFILMGIPAGVANGTNRFGLIWGNLASFYGLYRRGYFSWKILAPLVLPILLGAGAGAWCAVLIPDTIFQLFLAAVLIGVALLNVQYLWRNHKKLKSNSQVKSGVLTPQVTHAAGNIHGEQNYPIAPRPQLSFWSFVGFVLVGFYGGFIQVGMGFVLIFAFSLLAPMRLVQINALKSAIATLFMIQSFAIFFYYGKVQWDLAIIYAMGCVLGGFIGSLIQISQGDSFIRIAMVLISVVMAIKILANMMQIII